MKKIKKSHATITLNGVANYIFYENYCFASFSSIFSVFSDEEKERISVFFEDNLKCLRKPRKAEVRDAMEQLQLNASLTQIQRNVTF